MLSKFFKFRRAAAAPDLRTLAPGRTIFAVGDVHGRADLLKTLMLKIEADIDLHPPENPALVFLGDYIDRGEESAKTLDILEALWRRPKFETHFLIGNHEDAMLSFLEDPEEHRDWLRFGGLQTLMSYGVRGASEHASAALLLRARDALLEASQNHDAFLSEALRDSLQIGNVFFCHAAVDPDLSLKDQSRDTLLWGHPDFLERGGPDHAWIVHGHTIFPEPSIGPHRIGIDTGAYYSGRLTCARIDSGAIRFLSTA